MKYGIEVNVQKNHITTFPKPTLHFRVMRFKIMLCGRPHWGALGEKCMKQFSLEIIFLIMLSLSFSGCKGKSDIKKVAPTEQSENKKIESIENYSYDGNTEIIEIISGIDNKKTKYIVFKTDKKTLSQKLLSLALRHRNFCDLEENSDQYLKARLGRVFLWY